MTLKKRLRSVIVAIMAVCLLVTGASASAAGEATETSSVQPRWTAVMTIEAALDFNWLGGAQCYGRVSLENGYTGDLTVTLQRSANQIDWEDIKEWTTTGSGSVEIDKTYYVASGYYYDVKVVVDTYNAAGTYVETVTFFSSEVYH